MDKREVFKHSSAIQISNEVSLLQRRSWNVLLAHAFDELKDKDQFKIHLKDLCSTLGYDRRNEKHLKQLLRDLVDVKIEWNILKKDRNEWGIAVLLAQASIINGVLTYGYAPIIRERLQNPAMYAKINLSLQNRFESKHSLALYELFIDYFDYKRGSGETPWITVEDFRKLSGLKNEKYKRFKDISRYVIQKSLKEINRKSDLYVQSEYKRKDRKVTTIKFIIKKNTTTPDIKPLTGQKEKDEPCKVKEIVNKELFDILTSEFEINENKAIDILKTKDEIYIVEILEIVREQIKAGKVKSIPAFCVRAIEDDYRHKLVVEEEQEKQNTQIESKAIEVQNEREHRFDELRDSTHEYNAQTEELLSTLSTRIRPQSFNVFFKDTFISFATEESITLTVPSETIAQWISENYLEILYEVAGRSVEVVSV